MNIIFLIFLVFIGITFFSTSVKKKNIDDYMQDIQKQLSDELKIIR